MVVSQQNDNACDQKDQGHQSLHRETEEVGSQESGSGPVDVGRVREWVGDLDWRNSAIVRIAKDI